MLTALRANIIAAPALGKLEITEYGYLVLQDGVTLGVFPTLPEIYKTAQIEDFGDALLLQSFADMHLHAPQFPMVGMGMDIPLLDWLNTYTFPLEAAFKDIEYARAVYTQLAATLINNGTTRVCMYGTIHTDATLLLMRILDDAGITGYVGKVNMDRNAPDYLCESTGESLRETLRWLGECERFRNIRPMLTPRFVPSCTGELMGGIGRLAAARGLYIQSHLSENRSEMAWVKELHPDCGQYWETYEKYGLWKDHTIMAHCVHSDARERAAMREHGVYMCHCADSNINLASGIAPVRAMLDEGLRVVLGSDIAGGSQLPMLSVCAQSIRASKMRRILTGWTEEILTPAEVYYLATSAGAQYFGGGTGFPVGEPLHALVLDDKGFSKTVRTGANPPTLAQRLERAMYLADSRHIAAVFSAGRRVK
ncbi:MAG: amidohydrolase family protein [Clostridiales bacterium]|nr:amidohydrolase family protein [Clostridiales bacterium]